MNRRVSNKKQIRVRPARSLKTWRRHFKKLMRRNPVRQETIVDVVRAAEVRVPAVLPAKPRLGKRIKNFFGRRT